MTHRLDSSFRLKWSRPRRVVMGGGEVEGRMTSWIKLNQMQHDRWAHHTESHQIWFLVCCSLRLKASIWDSEHYRANNMRFTQVSLPPFAFLCSHLCSISSYLDNQFELCIHFVTLALQNTHSISWFYSPMPHRYQKSKIWILRDLFPANHAPWRWFAIMAAFFFLAAPLAGGV